LRTTSLLTKGAMGPMLRSIQWDRELRQTKTFSMALLILSDSQAMRIIPQSWLNEVNGRSRHESWWWAHRHAKAVRRGVILQPAGENERAVPRGAMQLPVGVSRGGGAPRGNGASRGHATTIWGE
jgi:hypothetical protein